MPYVGGSLTTFFNEVAQELTRKCAEEMCSIGLDRVKEITTMNTPVETGELRHSWKKTGPEPFMAEGSPAYRGTVGTDVDYAPFVEYGTGLFGPKHAPYVIRPKKTGGALRFMVGGKVVFARAVLHPGSPGNHMLHIGMDVTFAEMHDGAMFKARLAEWVRGVEGLAK